MKQFFTALYLFFLLSTQVNSQVSLPRSTPEAEGVSSKGIIEFLDAVAGTPNEMHSLMIIRNGKVIAEGWWDPYRPALKHTLYSLSKSFTSTAIGFAVSEKRISLADKVISFFPDKLPDTVSTFLSQLSIKDLITMSVGMAPDPSGLIAITDDWVKTFLSIPVRNKPGSVFLYNSGATYMLSAIIQKVTGEKLVDYLEPRLFQPLDISGIDWELDPNGINTGGYGLRVKTEDIAKFGLLYLQKGKWNGKQIIPTAWVEEATSFKIDIAPGMSQERKDSSDWRQGYCYQFWRSRYNSYRGDGAFGQYCLVLPLENAVIAITSETPNMQDELNLVWKYLLPALQANRSTLDKNDGLELKQKLAKLKVPLNETGSEVKPITISGTRYHFETNPKKISDIAFNEEDHIMTLKIRTDADAYDLKFGDGKWITGTTTMLGPSLVAAAKNHFVGLPPSQIAGSYRWVSNSTLEMQLRYIDSPHTLNMTYEFSGDNISVVLKDSFAPPDRKTTLQGAIVQ